MLYYSCDILIFLSVGALGGAYVNVLFKSYLGHNFLLIHDNLYKKKRSIRMLVMQRAFKSTVTKCILVYINQIYSKQLLYHI